MGKSALITGITGQDGSYLSELLLEKGYEVHGIVRRSSSINRERIDQFFDIDSHYSELASKNLHLHYGDMADSSALTRILMDTKPDEVYNLAAQSHVKVSFDVPEYTSDVVGVGTLRLMEVIRSCGLKPKIYQAGSSEMFGKVQEVPQSEKTPFYPRSPYAASKVFAHWIGVNYRESYGMFISNGILFNHESPRRGKNFVTRKVTNAVAAIKLGLQKNLVLGNLDAERDWGYAKDYVEAMWLMLQQDQPDDFVVATGEKHSVQELCEVAFKHVDLDYREFVKVSDKYKRPAEVDELLGDPSKAMSKLGWKPKMKFKELVEFMVDSDLQELKKEHNIS